MSPTQRTKAKLKAEGWPFVAVTERWNAFAKCRQDLFSFVDILALRQNELLAVQTTSGSNVSARLEKIRNAPAAAVWLSVPNHRLVVHGWRKVGARGKRKLWECREVEVTSVMLVTKKPAPNDSEAGRGSISGGSTVSSGTVSLARGS